MSQKTNQNSQNLKESNQSHCRKNFEKSYKSKRKEKGLGICVSHFHKVVYRKAI